MKKKILVVDDDKVIHDVIRDFFEYKGLEVITSFEAKEAFQKAKDESPDLIILDINMPKISGCALSVMLRENKGTKDIPIIFLTGYIDEKEASEIGNKMVGAALITKPFDLNDLLKAVSNILEIEL